MRTQDVPYEADGLAMIGRLAWIGDDPAPGVLVFPDAGGYGDHAIERAERLTAELGVASFVCDLHGNRQRIATMEEVMAAIAPLRSEASRVRARTVPALAAFAAMPQVDSSRVAAMGFCLGGTMAFELALAGADLRASVGFHSGLAVTSPQDAGAIKGAVLALIGADDPAIPPAQRDAFKAMCRGGNVDWQMVLFGGVLHAYTDRNAARLGRPEFARYDARADARSWRMTVDLLRETLSL